MKLRSLYKHIFYYQNIHYSDIFTAAIWNILDYLRDASKSNDLMDDAICRRMLKYVSGLNNASESIGGMHIRMHFLQFVSITYIINYL